MQPVDVLILSNGPGELATWVRPVLPLLRKQLESRYKLRISAVLSPCPNATGSEPAMAREFSEVDRVQSAQHFFPFLLLGRTADNWDWYERGVVLFLGGDQFFPVMIGKRLGYPTVAYGEWEARWLRWIDRFGVAQPEIVAQAPPKYRHKMTVVGDLMADAREAGGTRRQGDKGEKLIGILPGSKAAKLSQLMPLGLVIAEAVHAQNPQTRFVIPVAPTLELQTLARFCNPQHNPVIGLVGGTTAELVIPDPPNEHPYLKTTQGLEVELWTEFPAYDLLSQCELCLTTVGANTAELAALAIPMIVLLPTQQLDAMRSWDGIPGLLANLPGVGTNFAKLINWLVLRRKRLFAWPNIWTQEEIVPELVGNLQPSAVAEVALDWLNHPEKLSQLRSRLQSIRGQSGASEKITQLVWEELEAQN